MRNNNYEYHIEISVADKSEQKIKTHNISATSIMELMSKFTIKLLAIQKEIYETEHMKGATEHDDIPF